MSLSGHDHMNEAVGSNGPTNLSTQARSLGLPCVARTSSIPVFRARARNYPRRSCFGPSSRAVGLYLLETIRPLRLMEDKGHKGRKHKSEHACKSQPSDDKAILANHSTFHAGQIARDKQCLLVPRPPYAVNGWGRRHSFLVVWRGELPGRRLDSVWESCHSVLFLGLWLAVQKIGRRSPEIPNDRNGPVCSIRGWTLHGWLEQLR